MHSHVFSVSVLNLFVNAELGSDRHRNCIMKMRFFILFVAVLVGTINCNSQSLKDLKKEREAIAKMSKSELNSKATKAARKDAKKYKKDGWQTTPGALPLEKQLDRSYIMQYEFDENNYPKYIMGQAMSVGAHYDAARMQAFELAKQELAGQIQTEITALVENTLANEQLEAEEAASISKTIKAGKNLISQSIGRTIPVIELYRTLPNRNKEVLVVIAYNRDMAKKLAIKAVKRDLEKKGDELHKKLDELSGL